MTTLKMPRSPRWAVRLWRRLFGHPLRGHLLVINGKPHRILKVEGDTVTFEGDA